ncbi:MAG: malto-oligosyltrehalose trehalohydrolase [bacterium]
MRCGASYRGEGLCKFTVWAPFLSHVCCEIVSPEQRVIPLEKDDQGYWRGRGEGVWPGSRYYYRIAEDLLRPDPASFFQPEGINGPSEVIDHSYFSWTDGSWRGLPLEKLIIYELHIGAFTDKGTFEACIQRLDNLVELGITAIEVMPVAQFSGERNWGYDGVYPFAVQNSYGGPNGLKRLVNACHSRGIAVILDVVYNHMGPEGNHFPEFGPYFTDKYRTPWGSAINFDDAFCGGVREYFIQNALYWVSHFHIDALRLDAIHGIYDMGAKHILKELAERVEDYSSAEGRKAYLIAESDLNDIRVIRHKERGGYGLDVQWCDDFHHAVHALLTGEKSGYYMDFGKIEECVKAIKEGFVYSWDYSVFRKRNYGSSSRDIPASQMVAFIQNHDQVGNRMLGERLSNLLSFEALKLAAGVLLISPYIPLLFMGEEYAEPSPFLYFINHSDENLIEAVRKGRKREFAGFGWQVDPPDPQSTDTFLRSKLKWELQKEGKHHVMRNFYKSLIRLRGEVPALSHLEKANLNVSRIGATHTLLLSGWYKEGSICALMNFRNEAESVRIDSIKGRGTKILDSSDTQWLGPGVSAPPSIDNTQNIVIAPFGFVLYRMED